jgi:hypothetical protein
MQSRPRHKFTVSQRREQNFKEGFRSYATYRNLGISNATAGMVQAQDIALVKGAHVGGEFVLLERAQRFTTFRA